MVWKVALMVGAASLVAGCNGERVALPVALASLNRDLIGSNILSPDDAMDEEGSRTLIAAMHAVQNQFCMRNPSVMMLMGDFNLELEGTFGTSTTLGAGATGPVPTGSVSFGVSTNRTQTLKLPVTVTSLSNMPSIYQQYLVSNLKDVPDQKGEMEIVRQKTVALRSVVRQAIATFKPQNSSKPCADAVKRDRSPATPRPFNQIL